MIENLALASALALAPAITDKKTNPYKNPTAIEGSTNLIITENIQDETNKINYGEGIYKSTFLNVEGISISKYIDRNITPGMPAIPGLYDNYQIFKTNGCEKLERIIKLTPQQNATTIDGTLTISIYNTYDNTDLINDLKNYNTNLDKFNYINENLTNYLDTENGYYENSTNINTSDIYTSETYEYATNNYESTYVIHTTYRTNLLFPIIENTNMFYYTYVVDINSEVIDLPGLMFQILGMPFAFMSQAFNLTLFAGTPYAVNVSNLIFFIIAGLIIIVIVKKIIH